MSYFRVYVVETVESSYDVEAENVLEAERKVNAGDYDKATYKLVESYDSRIEDVESIEEEELVTL